MSLSRCSAQVDFKKSLQNKGVLKQSPRVSRRSCPSPSRGRPQAPQFTQPLKDSRCQQDSMATFRCQVSGNPVPSLRWMLNHRPLNECSGSFRATYDGHTACLDINNIGFQHMGSVTCVARNIHGEAASTARVVIIGIAASTRKLRSCSAPGTEKNSPVRIERDRNRPSSADRQIKKHSQLPNRSPSISRRTVKNPKEEVKRDSNRSISSNQNTKRNGPNQKTAVPNQNTRLNQLNKKNTVHSNIETKQSNIISKENTQKTMTKLKVGNTCVMAPVQSHLTPESAADLLPDTYNKLTFLTKLTDVSAVEGENVCLRVIIEGSSPYQVLWSQSGNEITKDDVRFERSASRDGTHVLLVKEITGQLAGVYECQAWNSLERVSCRCHVTVSEAELSPVFFDDPRPVEVEEGSAARLIVRVKGNPQPDVSWYRDGNLIQQGESIQLESNEVRHICTILNSQLSDSGLYDVVASNCFGKAMCSVSVQIHPKSEPLINPQQKHKRPLFVQPLTDLTIPEGAEAVLECQVVGVPPPQLTWFFEENILNSSEDIRISYHDHCAKLSVPKVLASHSGHFTCRAVNAAGEALSTANLTVVAPISAASIGKASPASIIKGPENTTLLRGGRAVLRIHYAGNPSPAIRWIKGGHSVVADNRISIESFEGMSTLSIDNVDSDDSGKYVVVAENEYGSDCHFTSLAVEGPPEPPAECPNIAEVNSSSITLSWYGSAYDGGSIITGYILEMKTIGDEESSQWQTVTSNCHSTSYKIKNLDPEAKYIFRVRAQNVHGVSSPSQESESVTISDFKKEKRKSVSSEEEDPCSSSPFEFRTVEFENKDSFHDLFDVKEEIGKGRFGTVHKVIEKKTGETFAAKFIKCIKLKDKEKVREEVAIMNCLRHPKLLQLAAAFENSREMVMVLEYISGGELFERVVAEDFILTERDCILFTRQICDGARYMHEKQIIHLDLKPENILCLTRHSHHIKLIDFGLAQRYDPNTPLRVMFGTPEFIAPEVINYEPISPASDMWSIGVLCYVLLSGLSPFMGDNDAETFSNITRAEFDFDDDAFGRISSEAKSFISNLLIKKKEKRLTADDCLKHHWLAQHERTMSTMQLNTDKLKKFIIRRKWQKTGNAIRALGRMVSLSGLSSRRSSWNSSRSGSGGIGESEQSFGSIKGLSKEQSIQEGEEVFEEDPLQSSPENKNMEEKKETSGTDNEQFEKSLKNIDSQYQGKDDTWIINKHLSNWSNADEHLNNKSEKGSLKDLDNEEVLLSSDLILSQPKCEAQESKVIGNFQNDKQRSVRTDSETTTVKSPTDSPKVKRDFDALKLQNLQHDSTKVSSTDQSPSESPSVEKRHSAASKFGVVLRTTDTRYCSSNASIPSSPLIRIRNAIKPEFIKAFKEEMCVRLGSVARFEVQIEGRPSPQVHWFRNNVPVFESRREKIMQVGNGIHSLMILNVKKADEAVYRFCASNEAGEIVTEGKLIVI